MGAAESILPKLLVQKLTQCRQMPGSLYSHHLRNSVTMCNSITQCGSAVSLSVSYSGQGQPLSRSGRLIFKKLIIQQRLRLKVERSLAYINPRGTLSDYMCVCVCFGLLFNPPGNTSQRHFACLEMKTPVPK